MLVIIMGAYLSQMITKLMGKREARLLMLGLDAAGKTSILYKMKIGELIPSNPTIGFNMETVEYQKCKLNVWDIGGQDALRKMWRHYYENTNGFVYVVDSSDRDRLALAREELHRVLSDELLDGVPLLVYANKMDLGLMDVKEIVNGLDLASLKGRTWHCQGSSALTGEGIFEGMDWLYKKIETTPISN